MRNAPIIVALILIATGTSGCAIFGSVEGKITPPTLIEKVALPTPPAGNENMFLKAELLVAKDGSVRLVRLLTSSGDSKWDSDAVDIIKQWKYSPPLENNVPVQMRIVQIAHVVATPPLQVHLAQLFFKTESQADSALALLKAGASFDSLAGTNSIKNSVLHGGDLGDVDVHLFPQDIQGELSSLKQGQLSQVLPMGPYYSIFKRIK